MLCKHLKVGGLGGLRLLDVDAGLVVADHRRSLNHAGFELRVVVQLHGGFALKLLLLVGVVSGEVLKVCQ